MSDDLNTIKIEIPKDTADTSQAKVNHLRECQKAHKMNDINYRLTQLKKLLTLWEKYEEEIHLSNYLDLGQSKFVSEYTTYFQVRGEIIHAIDNLKTWVKPRKCDASFCFPLCSNYVKPEPFGVVLIFSAWNCNFLTLIIPIVQALAAGNLVLAKPASTAPETQKVCVKILSEMDQDVINVCWGGSEVREKLLDNRFDLLIFTGSAKIGKVIAQKAAPHLTPTILELGGQNPVIVEKSSNIETAAYNITYGRHAINGQACISPEYVLVDKDIFDKFLEKLKETYVNFYGKSEENKSSEALGKMVNIKYSERLFNLIKDPGQGAKLEYGGEQFCDVNNRFIAPTIFSFGNIDDLKNSNLAKEELFGPVLYTAPYDKIEDAVNYINSREKPLASYLFSNDSRMKDYVRDNTSAGVLVINDTIIHFAQPFVPFGGVGNSGMGAYHGKFGFFNMSHWKPIVNSSSILINLRYPKFNETKKKLVRFTQKNVKWGELQVLGWVKNAIIVFVVAILLMKLLKCNK